LLLKEYIINQTEFVDILVILCLHPEFIAQVDFPQRYISVMRSKCKLLSCSDPRVTVNNTEDLPHMAMTNELKP
jgi:hypothetical protein